MPYILTFCDLCPKIKDNAILEKIRLGDGIKWVKFKVRGEKSEASERPDGGRDFSIFLCSRCLECIYVGRDRQTVVPGLGFRSNRPES